MCVQERSVPVTLILGPFYILLSVPHLEVLLLSFFGKHVVLFEGGRMRPPTPSPDDTFKAREDELHAVEGGGGTR